MKLLNTNHFGSLLQQLFEQCPQYAREHSREPWVLATLIEKNGSSYRNLGAMMLIDPDGKPYGGLSGGCLEKDIIKQAHKVSHTGMRHIQEYDTRDPEDHFARSELGVNSGCQGQIFILLQVIDLELYSALQKTWAWWQAGIQSFLYLAIDSTAEVAAFASLESDAESIEEINTADYFKAVIDAPKHLLIVGGGYDAIPIMQLAKQMAWRVTVWDDRLHYAKESDFCLADNIITKPVELSKEFSKETALSQVDAAVLVTHNLSKDAAWLGLLKTYTEHIPYVGLIGPIKRQNLVKQCCHQEYNIEITNEWCESRLFSPAGFDIGGDTPESVALSIVAQVHQVYYLRRRVLQNR